MGRERALLWSKEKDDALRELFASGASLRSIASTLGMYAPQVSRRIEKLGLKAEPTVTVATHIVDYKRARRGFHVPEHLEAQYYDLLKEGLPIIQICDRLGIKTNQPRGE